MYITTGLNDLQMACQQHMEENGLKCDDPIITDGKIHRYSTDGNRSKRDEWYIAHEFTSPRGELHLLVIYGSWTDGSKFEFKSWQQDNDSHLDTATLKQLNEQAQYKREAAEKELHATHEKQSTIAQKLWSTASDTPPSEDHLYYPKLKGIEPIGAKFITMHESATVVLPLKNIHGEVRSLQFLKLTADRTIEKRFLSGGEKKGNFHLLGDISADHPLYVTEGWATGVSVYTASQAAVAIAFDASNIAPVVEAIRHRFPQVTIIIAGDNDATGIKKATEAAQTFSCTTVSPEFPQHAQADAHGKPYTDFNDLHQACGIEEVREQINAKKSSTDKSDAVSLNSELPPQNDPCANFSVQKLPPILSAYVQSICETTNAHPIMVTSAALGMISAFLGRRVFIFGDTYFQTLYPNLWMISIAESGQFKSTALNKGAKIAMERSKEVSMCIKDLRRELSRETNEQRKIDLKERILEASLRDVVLPNKFTTEALLEHLSQGHSGVILTSEFGGWLLNLEKNFNGDLKALFTELYDVPPAYRYKTRTQGDFSLNDPYISICGVSTFAWLQAHTKPEDLESGFLARFLIFAPPQQYSIPSALPIKQIQPDPSIEQAVRDLLNNMDDVYDYTLSESARGIFDALHREIYTIVDSYNEKCRALLEPYTKRWSPYLLKLAMIMQLFTDRESKEITAEALFYAYNVLLPAIKSTVHIIAGELGESDHQRKCRKVYNWICKQIKDRGYAQRDKLLSSHVLDGGAKEYDYVLTTLNEQGKIMTIEATLISEYRYVLKNK